LDQLQVFKPRSVLIEDKASGTQLIQELIADGIQATTRYEPSMDKIMRMFSVSNTIENGFVYLPSKAPWLAEYLHELATFPKGKYDDQVDSTSQAFDWFKNCSGIGELGLLRYFEREAQIIEAGRRILDQTSPMPCTKCDGFLTQRIADFLRCPQCETQYWPQPRRVTGFSPADALSYQR
jgi:hypothetical protein